MSTDLITEIQAQPRVFADKLETMRTALEAVTAQLAVVTAERNTFKSACLQMDARDLKRAAAARKVAQWARGQAYELHISELCFAHAREDAETAEAERDAARREVARLNAFIQANITAPATCPECHGTRRVDSELGRIICPMCKDTAPAQVLTVDGHTAVSVELDTTNVRPEAPTMKPFDPLDPPARSWLGDDTAKVS